MEDRWLSLQEIGEYLGAKKHALLKWIKEKDMPAHKLGRSWKFKKEEVDEWIKSGKAGNGD